MNDFHEWEDAPKSQIPSDCGNYPDDWEDEYNKPNEEKFKMTLWQEIQYWGGWTIVLCCIIGAICLIIRGCHELQLKN